MAPSPGPGDFEVAEYPESPTSTDPRPLGGSVLVGLIASLCCGGTLLFGSIGLGAFYGSLGLARYIPQALALGAASVVAINWLFYRRKASRPGCDCQALRRSMLASTAFGLFAMSGSFVLLEWLNHGVVNAARFGHGSAAHTTSGVLPWTSNANLLYAGLAIVLGLLLAAILPFPNPGFRTDERSAAVQAS